MLYNFQRKKLCRHLLVGGALCAASLGIFSCTDTYDLGTKQPEGLNSIYEYMNEQGKFTNYLRLIDDLGQKEILSKTGSKTMFIADDAAFDKFYSSNSWGVKKYEQLSPAQKKLLLYSAMIDNPYSTSMLSSAASIGDNGKPVKGEVCRRSSSLALYDSVTVVPKDDPDGILPKNDRFNEILVGRDSIVLFTDASNAAPMIHFTGKFITSNKMELTDVDFIYNQAPGTFKSDDVYVNNSKVVKSNIFCKNGFIHEVDKVIVPLDNMAEIIRKTPEVSTFSSIIERFAAPDDSVRLTDAYNVNRGSKVDSVFVKRYFSDRSAGSTMNRSVAFQFDKNGTPFDASLKFDPGWNGYVPDINNVREPMMEDMAVMLVPSNAAVDHWWGHGGSVIANYYGSLKNTPNSVLAKLVNVNQLTSFAESVPSKFDDVLDDANEPMYITPADVDSVIIGCNGLVYITNKVFAPTSYKSVLFPAVIDTTNFRIISNAIDNMNYDKYLNSMVSEYTFLIPTNKGLLSYIDPVSYGSAKTKLWEFYLDLSKAKSKQICATVYDCMLDGDGNWVKDPDGDKPITITGGTDNAIIRDRMEDLLDNIIVTRGYQPGKKFYITKGRSFVKIEEKNGDVYVSGSWQDENQKPLKAIQTYEMSNGNAFVLDGVVMGTRNSVAKTLAQNPDFSEFLGIMQACGALATQDTKDKWQAGDQEFGNLFNIKNAGAVGAEDTKTGTKASYLLNNFHYTMYVPTNDAMQMAYEAGLPTLDMLEEAYVEDDSLGLDPAKDPESKQAVLMEAMLDFVKYHIQDNSIYVDEGFESGEYESGKTELIKSTAIKEEVAEADIESIGNVTKVEKDEKGTYTVSYWNGKYSPGRPYKLKVSVSGSDMYVEDCRNGYDPNTHQSLGGEKAKIIMKEGYYNLMAREYWLESSSKISSPHTVQINNSSAVAVHGIDKPLIYSDGMHYDSKGLLSPTQFIYTHKPLTSDAKRR